MLRIPPPPGPPVTATDTRLPDLRDKRLLVVEDEYLVADDIRRDLEELGAQVIGPAPSVASALAMLDEDAALDGAILDINLCGEMVFPVAGALHARRVPFVFWSGYAAPGMPAAYDDVPRLQKPSTVADVVRALLRDIAAPVDTRTAALADLYITDDGAHLLATRAGPAPLVDDGLVWVGAAFINVAEWSRRLRTPLRPGALVRVPWRYIAGLRQELAVMG